MSLEPEKPSRSRCPPAKEKVMDGKSCAADCPNAAERRVKCELKCVLWMERLGGQGDLNFSHGGEWGLQKEEESG